MKDLVNSGSAAPTMTSREIAELCDARHNDVVATIERLFAKGVLRESRKTTRPHRPEGGGRPTEVYDLTKRDTLVVASGYNDELRAKIIDRWEELEHQGRGPAALDYSDPAVVLGVIVSLQGEVAKKDDVIAQLTPKAEALDLISASSGSVTITQASKILSMKRADLTAWMHSNNWVYRQNGSWVAYKPQIENGRLEYKEANYTDQTTGMACRKSYCHITQKGLIKLAMVFGVTLSQAA